MRINLPKAMVGLGTTGIGDNFARQRLLMAQKAGYVKSTPGPYSQPGTALAQYKSVMPVLQQVAKAQNQKGIPGLLRTGMQNPVSRPQNPGRQPQPLVNTPLPLFSSQVAGHTSGNPFAFNSETKPQPKPDPGVRPPVIPPGYVGGGKGGEAMPGLPQGGTFNPPTSPLPPSGGIHGTPPGPVGDFSPGGSYGGTYPPGTILNSHIVNLPMPPQRPVDPRIGLLTMLLAGRR